VETKICSKCKQEKICNLFGKHKQRLDGLRSVCNECRKIESKKYLEKNSEKRKETISKYYRNNTDVWKKYAKKMMETNHEKLKEIKNKSYHKNKEKHKERLKKYRSDNKTLRTEYQKKLLKTSIVYKVSSTCRSRIYTFLKVKNITKRNKTFEIVGCSPQFLKEYLEQKFTEGMSWDLMGKHIHIDHIIPLSSVNTEEEVYKLCHYTNLQPLWAEDNLKKGDKIL
jgi:hypothetical protein